MTEMEAFDGNMAAVRLGQAAGAAWEALQNELVDEQKRLDREIFKEMAQNRLTPERAMEFCHAKYAHFRLVQSLQQKIKSGVGAGRALAPVFEGGHDDA